MGRRADTLAKGVGFTEGPIFRTGGDVVVVSIDQGCLYRIAGEESEVLAVTGGGPNGAAEGHDGCIYVAQNGGKPPAHRWPYVTGGVQVVRPGGLVEWITQDPVSPNDICFGPDGLLYVTDPTRNGRYDDGRLWRCDPVTGESELLASVAWYPNGIGFGPDDRLLFVASSADATIRAFELTGVGLGSSEIVVTMNEGRPDGFAFDVDGNIVIAAIGDNRVTGSIQVWTLDGKLVEVFRPGTSQYYTNVALNSDAELVITDSSTDSVLIVENWPAAGLPLHPFRA